jgi:hypothetical protein
MTKPRNQRLFTIGQRCGRLCNRIIMFANVIALAEEQGDRVVNYTFHTYSDLFEDTRANFHCAYPVPRRKSWLDRIPGLGAAIHKTRIFYHLTRYFSLFNARVPLFGRRVATLRQLPDRRVTLMNGPELQEKINAARLIFVYGWWVRVPDLVQKHAVKIRAYFRPVGEYETASREVVDRLRKDADIVVGVHVRHGDNRIWRGGKYFFPTECYAAWMRELIPQFPNRKVSFLVCSDEPRNAGEFPGLPVTFGSKSHVTDLYSLARCDYILGTKSTFSQWASYYGEKPLLQVCERDEPVKLEKFRVCHTLDWD